MQLELCHSHEPQVTAAPARVWNCECETGFSRRLPSEEFTYDRNAHVIEKQPDKGRCEPHVLLSSTSSGGRASAPLPLRGRGELAQRGLYPQVSKQRDVLIPSTTSI